MADPKYLRDDMQSLLGHFAEECGEALAAVGKTLRWGENSSNPELRPQEREANGDWILREMADLDLASSRLRAALTANGFGPKGIPLPAQPAREDDQKALRAAALEEAARLCDAVTERYAPGGKGSPIPTTWPEIASRMCADRIRALAGSPAGRSGNQELLGKKGGE